MKRYKVYHLFVLLLTLFLLTGCMKKIEKPMVLAANLWIGYAPLYYAYEEGWFRENNIKFAATISLGQTLKYYKKTSFDMFAGTNYEYSEAKKVVKDLMGVKLLDISKEGDLIYSNKNINELKNSKKIDILFEVDSVSSLLLNKFVKRYRLKKEQLNLINTAEDSILNIKMKKNPTLIVTYKPYDMYLKKRGYKIIANASSLNFTIFDALFVSKKYAQNHKEEIAKVVMLFDKALSVLKKDPCKFYMVINPYFNYKKYDDFIKDLDSISWKSSRDLNSLLNDGRMK